nr:RNA polymerase sigma factor SigM [Streptacidiphilus carbonis]
MAGTPQEVSDAELLARHVAGDHDAFGELVQRHRDRLWAVALRTLGDREEAADALQDALVSAFRAAHTFQGRSAVTTWLHRIVVNACLDRVRRNASRPTRPLDEQTTPDDLLGHGEGADVSAERSELRRELGTALATLPPEQRAALVLVDVQGYPVAEAARILDIPIGTIKSRCARARARLLPQIAHLRRPVPQAPIPRGTTPEPPADGAGVSRETDGPVLPHAPTGGDTAPPGREGNPNEGPTVPLLANRRPDAGGEQPT